MKDKIRPIAIGAALIVGGGARIAKCGKAARFADEGVTVARLSDPAADAARQADIFDVPADALTHGAVAADEATRALEAARLEARLNRAQAGAEVAEAAIDAAAGEPMSTPDDLAAPFTEEGGEAELTAILDELGAGRITHLDCGEFPCVAQITFQATEGDLTELREAFTAAFQAGPYRHVSNFRYRMANSPSEDMVDTLSVVVPLRPVLPPELMKRVDFRLDEVPSVGLGPL